jgi:hypothetical protein
MSCLFTQRSGHFYSCPSFWDRTPDNSTNPYPFTGSHVYEHAFGVPYDARSHGGGPSGLD